MLVQTYYATAQAKANITSYGQVLAVNVSCANATGVESSISSLLTVMERNGSVSNFYSPSPGQILVQLGNYTAYGAYAYLAGRIGAGASCASFASQATVQLPASMPFRIPLAKSTLTVEIPSGQRSFVLPVVLSAGMVRSVNVSVAALVTETGAVYGNMTVTRA